jgi:ATP-dependent Clp protease ATP-binding subunit ClpA
VTAPPDTISPAELVARTTDLAGEIAWLARTRPERSTVGSSIEPARGGVVFERFTDRARRVVVLAQEESRRLNHNFIGTEHILLGLIQEREGVAAQALGALGIRLEAVRARVEEIVGRGESTPSGHIPFTPRAKKVLELSLREALQFGHNYIGTEHLLLGLIREGEGVAATVLVGLGADLESVRQKVVQLLAGRPGSGVPPELLADPGTRAAVIATAVPYEPGQTSTSPGGELFRAALDRLVLRRFTVSSCRVLLLAESEALRLGTTTVGPEHLLLGLLAEGEGAAAVALGAMGIDLATARDEADRALGRRPLGGPARATFSDLALDALERALAEALTVGRDTVDTRELLLGLVQQAERGLGLMEATFGLLGTSAAAVRETVTAAESDPDAGPESPAGEP